MLPVVVVVVVVVAAVAAEMGLRASYIDCIEQQQLQQQQAEWAVDCRQLTEYGRAQAASLTLSLPFPIWACVPGAKGSWYCFVMLAVSSVQAYAFQELELAAQRFSQPTLGMWMRYPQLEAFLRPKARPRLPRRSLSMS